MTFTTNLKNNHFVVSLTMIVLAAGTMTAIGQITGWYDAGHTSAEELLVVEDQIRKTSIRSKCSTLSIQISLAEQAIWQMEQVDNNSQRLVEKRRTLRGLISQYNEARCATILASI